MCAHVRRKDKPETPEMLTCGWWVGIWQREIGLRQDFWRYVSTKFDFWPMWIFYIFKNKTQLKKEYNGKSWNSVQTEKGPNCVLRWSHNQQMNKLMQVTLNTVLWFFSRIYLLRTKRTANKRCTLPRFSVSENSGIILKLSEAQISQCVNAISTMLFTVKKEIKILRNRRWEAL